MAEAEVGAGGVGVAGARGLAAFMVVGGRLAQVGVVEAGAGEVGVLARGRSVGLVEVVVDEVEHEDGVDDPDAGGEVPAAVVHVGVVAGAGAVADLAGDPQLQRGSACSVGERVELGVELVGLAAEQADGLLAPGRR